MHDRAESGSGYSDEIVCGNALDVAARLPLSHIQTIVTSPPYFRLRDYGTSGEVGSESTGREYVESIAGVMHALRPALKTTGTLWLNLGDVYVKGELQGIPWQVALALKADGWKLISDVIWHKPNAMPSSNTKRPTVDHEYLFLFARESNYYYDADAIREPHRTFSAESRMRGGRSHLAGGTTPELGKFRGRQGLHDGSWERAFHPRGRNKRTVWNVPLGKSRDHHFAVFPEPLITPCILATSAPGDIVLDPFLGSGTTAVVAAKLGRRYLGIDLVEEYCRMAAERVQSAANGPVQL